MKPQTRHITILAPLGHCADEPAAHPPRRRAASVLHCICHYHFQEITTMTTDKKNTPSDKERFELILWNIEMLDSRRTSVANRAAIVLSADALLLAAATFLLDKTLTSIAQYNTVERIVLALSLGASMALLVLSIGFATAGIANVWKTSRQMLGSLASDMPQRLFFHPTDTVKTFRGFKAFQESFNTTNKEEMATFALAELWTVINQHYTRYQVLRRTIKLLILSIIPFFVAVIIVLVKYS
jgi:hypothetical protein